jgi:heme oxygenase (biliverdin-IX-beta and delta-forming)
MAGVVGSTPAHLLLREATRDAHEAAEATAGMRLLLAGDLDEAGYAELLRAQLTLFRAWEAERSGWLARLEEWRYVSRASLIEADLCRGRFIGDAARDNATFPAATSIADESAPTERGLAATEWGAVRGDAAHWGELYVIEGSALGGRVIVRRLRELYPQLSHTFYAVGENTPSSWRRFQSLLDDALPDEASQEAAIYAAQRMFARFQQTLKDPAAHD